MKFCVSLTINIIKFHAIVSNKFVYKLYDKRDDFPFSIVKMPHKDSNIPYRMFYSTIAAETLRICRASSTSNHASSSIQALVARMKGQCADLLQMKNSIRRMINRHQISQKYGMDSNQFFDQIFIWYAGNNFRFWNCIYFL